MDGLERLRTRAARCRRDARLVAGARVLALLFVVAGGFDVVATNAALAAGQIEGNPLVAAVQAGLGPWWSAPKITLHLVLALFILWLPSRKMLTVARLVIAGYAVIIVNNFYLAGWPV